jgi:hypothetical protein
MIQGTDQPILIALEHILKPVVDRVGANGIVDA